ncbi:MAG TPA: VCBS repeat-containing protein, partial [Tepidisphaeraceae bacterium]|nr:VCBS repeat-containing protein [Tepidisphaeraceae bacterium]
AATNPPQFIRATREILLFFEENFAIINAEIVDEIRFATETSYVPVSFFRPGFILHNDVVRGDTWFENKDGRGLEWVAHKNIPMGRRGPFGVCVRTMIADMDGNGKMVIVMCDADISDSKIYILRTPDKGQSWTKQALPQSFQYGSLHSLAVADFKGNGRLDIVSNEQEELLPAGRTNPRFVVWENLGDQKYAEHIILDEKLGGHELQVGDVKGDGVIDICSKAWGVQPWNGNGGKMHVDYLENVLHDKKATGASKGIAPGKP